MFEGRLEKGQAHRSLLWVEKNDETIHRHLERNSHVPLLASQTMFCPNYGHVRLACGVLASYGVVDTVVLEMLVTQKEYECNSALELAYHV